MADDHRPSIPNDEHDEAVRDQGMPREKAARIANSDGAARRGGESPPSEEWTKDELYERARELDVDGRSSMTEAEVIRALRTG